MVLTLTHLNFLNQCKMKNITLLLLFLFLTASMFAQTNQVSVVKDNDGHKLMVDGKELIINGMNWGYVPIGTNVVNAEFWKKPDDIIRAGLDAEMALLKNMNVRL